MTAFLDQPSNFAYVTALQGYASGVTTITLQSGDGSRLPATAGYNLVWWNDTDFSGNPAADTLREIIRVTARSGDVLTTIVRAQESTTNNNHNISGKTYRLALCVTKKTIDDIDAKISGLVKSRFKANVAVDQTLSTSTLTKVKYATEQYDAASEYNPADPTYRFTAAVTGYYFVQAQVAWNVVTADSATSLLLRLVKNATTTLAEAEDRANETRKCQSLATIVSLTAGDYVEVFAQKNCSSATYIYGAAEKSFFSGHSVFQGNT